MARGDISTVMGTPSSSLRGFSSVVVADVASDFEGGGGGGVEFNVVGAVSGARREVKVDSDFERGEACLRRALEVSWG